MSAVREALEDRFARIMALSQIHGVLHWDRETILPSGGAEPRVDKLVVLELLAREHKTDSSPSDLLDEAEAVYPHAPWQSKNLEMICAARGAMRTGDRRPAPDLGV
ncbi:MAG: hypothetical protein GDA49_11275 [Rhodospirillales bacterium]|nr:hypothetical protein [Rhodospirillales bacterium]